MKQMRNSKNVGISSVKREMDKIATERIARVVNASGLGQVKDISLLKGDASTRSYARVYLQDGRTIVAMILGNKDKGIVPEEFVEVQEKFQELPYLNVGRYLRKAGCRIPEVYAVDENEGVLLIEDFGDILLEKVVKQSDSFPAHIYRKAIDELIKMQRFSIEHPDESCYAFQLAFTERVYLWEFEHFLDYAVDFAGWLPLSPDRREDVQELFRLASRELASLSRVFVHRDYHSRNLMVIDDGPPGILDFQDAVKGSVFYDLASLLRDAYVEIPEKEEESLLYYFQESARHITSQERENFRYYYELSALQRDLKAAGRFYYIFYVKGNASFLVHVLPALRNARKSARWLSENRSEKWSLLYNLIERLIFIEERQ